MFKKKGKIISLGIITSFVLGAFLFSGVTFAAFLNTLKIHNEIKSPTLDPSKIEGKFAAGTGTEINPFLINTSEQLRNLQKLNMLDIFTPDHYFALGQDITWDNVPLLPIGNEDHPFVSKFDGRTHVIKNLVVDGKDTNDVGMFGYTGIHSNIKNIILDHPIINVLPNNDGGTDESANIVIDKKINPAPQDFNLTVNSSTIFLPKDKGGKLIDTVSYTELNSAGQSVTRNLKVKYVSSDEKVLKIVDGVSDYKLSALPDSSKVHMGLYLLQIEAKVSYLDYIDLTIHDYTIERWNIELKVDLTGSTISVNSTTDSKNKTTYYFHKNINDPNNPHGLNVGFLIGHCDGSASHLGVYGGNSNNASTNGIIKLHGRKAKSSSCLIGRERRDNALDNTAKNRMNKLLDFVEYPKVTGNIPSLSGNSTLDSMPMVDISAPYDQKLKESPDSVTNKKITKAVVDQTKRSRKFTRKLLKEPENMDKANRVSEFLRYYPKFINGDDIGDSSIVNRNFGNVTRNFLRITDPVRVGAFISSKAGGSNSSNSIVMREDIDSNGKKHQAKDSVHYSENGLWLYATNDLADSFLGALFAQPEGFDVELKLKYIVNAVKGKENVPSTAEFVAFRNLFEPGRFSDYRTWWGEIRQAYHSDVGSILWEETPMRVEDPKNPPTAKLIELDKGESYGKIIERSLNYEATNKSSNRDSISPMFTFGIGKGQYNSNGKPIIKQRTNCDQIESNGLPHMEPYGGTILTSDFGHENGTQYNPQTKTYENVFDKRLYYERQETWDPNIQSVDVLDIDVSFKTKDGNTSSLTNHIDFLSQTTGVTYTPPKIDTNDKKTVIPSSTTGWQTNSNTKIHFDLNELSNAENRFYRSSSTLAVVYLYYNGPNSYVPGNTPKFNTATIEKDPNISIV